MAKYIIKREGCVTKSMQSESTRIEELRKMLPASWGDDNISARTWVELRVDEVFCVLTHTPDALRAKGWSWTGAPPNGETWLDRLFFEANCTKPGLQALRKLAVKFLDRGLPMPPKLLEFARAAILNDLPKQRRNRPTSDMLLVQDYTLFRLFEESIIHGAPSHMQAYKEVAEATGLFKNHEDPADAMRKRLERYGKRNAGR